ALILRTCGQDLCTAGIPAGAPTEMSAVQRSGPLAAVDGRGSARAPLRAKEIVVTAPLVAHPSTDTLLAIGAGKLDHAIAARVCAHLQTCEQCRRQAAGLPDDSFLKRLRDIQSRSGPPAPSCVTDLTTVMKPAGRPSPPAPGIPDLLPELRDHPQYLVLC